MVDDTTRLLGLEGLAITGVDESVGEPVTHLATADEQAWRCPECGTRRAGRRGSGLAGPGSDRRRSATEAGAAQAPLALR
jgi:hypothetical protein